jgi:alpha-glucosidase
MPWAGQETPFGFSTGKPWLPLPSTWKDLTVESQINDKDGSLSLYKSALSERAKLFSDAHDFTWDTSRIDVGVLGFSRAGIQVYLNSGDKSVSLPATEIILASSGPMAVLNGELELKEGNAIWFKL